MSRFLTGALGALVEAWTQLRINRLRVMLSLVGVGAAVAAMTFIIAFGDVSAAVQQEQIQRYTGRPGTIQVQISPTDAQDSQDQDQGAAPQEPGAPGAPEGPADQGGSAGSQTAERIVQAQRDFVERYQVTRWATSTSATLRLSVAGAPVNVDSTVVSAGYGIIHRVDVAQGRWFRAQDADDMSPSIVVSQSVLDQLGISELTGPVKVQALRPVRTTYTIVGALSKDSQEESCSSGQDGQEECTASLTAYVLDEPYERLLPASAERSIPVFEVWAGQDNGPAMKGLVTQYFDGMFGHGSTQVVSNALDTQEGVTRTFRISVTAAGVLVMVLGALGLVNISMVTVRQRIHEIGVRRSFGATSARVFVSIMLESVVATVVAGVIGIGAAIVAMRFLPLEAILHYEPSVRPPFPMSAAFIGLVAATVVGALAGIIPAVVAVRIRPIDAIRF